LFMSVKHRAQGFALAGVLTGASSWMGAAPPADSTLAEARQELRISEAMAERIRARLVHVRQLPNVTAEELAELERYWQRLKGAVRAHRAEVGRLEADGRIGARFEGAEEVRAPGSRSGFVIVPERTEADDIEVLDAELNSSLSRFDEMLLKEMNRLRRSAGSSSAHAGDAAASTMSRSADEGTGQPAGKGADKTAERGESDTTERPEGGAEGFPRRPNGAPPPRAGHVGARPPIPPDIPDGSDDDLVARQIREAAMNEPDPALRKKLWEEYRKYKRDAG
jgi:hypothetical protein